MKKSPLERLELSIENEIYVLGIDNHRHPGKYNHEWLIGYYDALKNVLDKIAEIRRGQL